MVQIIILIVLSFPAATNNLTSYLNTISGTGKKVVINGVEYGIDSNKVAGAVAELEDTLSNLKPVVLAPGLYETGAIALYEEGDYEAASAMLKTSWEELEASGVIVIGEGEDIDLPDMNEYGFYYGVPYSTAMGGATVGFTFNEDGSAIFDTPDGPMEIPAGAIIYGDHSIDMTALDMPILEVSPDGIQMEADGLALSVGSGLPAKGAVYLPNLNVNNPVSIIEGDLVLPNDGRVTTLVTGAFIGQTALTGIIIPDSVTTISMAAFWNCDSLTSIVLPDSVTTIGRKAFSGCSSLTSVVIGNGVATIDMRAFAGCPNLASVTFGGTIKEWNTITKGANWNSNVPATYVQCTDGQVAL